MRQEAGADFRNDVRPSARAAIAGAVAGGAPARTRVHNGVGGNVSDGTPSRKSGKFHEFGYGTLVHEVAPALVEGKQPRRKETDAIMCQIRPPRRIRQSVDVGTSLIGAGWEKGWIADIDVVGSGLASTAERLVARDSRICAEVGVAAGIPPKVNRIDLRTPIEESGFNNCSAQGDSDGLS